MNKKENRFPFVINNRGDKIFAVLHEPLETKKKPPVVVVFHGFSSSKIGTNRSYVYLGEVLSAQGIATCRFDFRGSGDSEGDLSNLSFEDLISDGIAITHALEKEGYEQFGFFGSSLGGSIATYVGAEIKNIKALALWAPVASGKLWLEDWIVSKGITPQKDPKELFSTYLGKKLSARYREEFGNMDAALVAGTLKIPLLHMQGEKDEIVSIKHQKAFQMARKQESSFILYPETTHALGFAPELFEILKTASKWFKEHL